MIYPAIRSKSGLLIIFLCLLLIVSCKKDQKENPETEVPAVTKNLEMDKGSATPGDIITVKTTFIIEKSAYALTVGTKKVPLIKVDDSTATFMVPYIPSGNLEIDFSVTGSSIKKPFVIAAYTPVTDPEPVINTYKTNIAVAITELQTNKTQAYADILKSLELTFNTEYAKLSTDEKKELAFTIAKLNEAAIVDANSTSRTSLQVKSEADTDAPGLISDDNGEEVVKAGHKFVRLVLKTVAYATGSSLLISIPDLLVTKVLGVTTASLAVAYFARSIVQIDIILAKIFGHTAFIDFVSPGNTLSQKRVVLNARSAVMATSTGGAVPEDFTFSKSKPVISFQAQSAYRALSDKDKSNSNSFYRDMFTYTTMMVNMHAQLKSTLDNIKSLFTSTPAIPAYNNPIPAEPVTATRVTPANLITIENISDPAVKLNLSAGASILTLNSEGTVVTAEKSFSFDLVYKNDKLGITNRKTISATYSNKAIPEKIALLSGNDQVSSGGSKLAAPLKVKVTGANQTVLEGIKVTWVVKSGSGTISTAESLTDVNGTAQTEWTPGATGLQLVEASVNKSDGTPVSGSPVIFRASALNLTGKWQVISDVWKLYDPSGAYTESKIGEPFTIDFLAGNKVTLHDARYSDDDTGDYALDPTGQYLTITGTTGDDYSFRYFITEIKENSFTLTSDKTSDYYNIPGYAILELKLQK